MRPDMPRTLNGVAENLMTVVLPELQTPHGRQVVSLAARLASMAAQEFDRAAARLVEENAGLIQVLRDLRPLTEGELLRDLDRAIAAPLNKDLRVSALQQENDVLRALLIRLHERVEALPPEQGAKANEAIWDELRQSTRRRHLDSGLA
jgi:hypothetical protein